MEVEPAGAGGGPSSKPSGQAGPSPAVHHAGIDSSTGNKPLGKLGSGLKKMKQQGQKKKSLAELGSGLPAGKRPLAEALSKPSAVSGAPLARPAVAGHPEQKGGEPDPSPHPAGGASAIALSPPLAPPQAAAQLMEPTPVIEAVSELPDDASAVGRGTSVPKTAVKPAQEAHMLVTAVPAPSPPAAQGCEPQGVGEETARASGSASLSAAVEHGPGGEPAAARGPAGLPAATEGPHMGKDLGCAEGTGAGVGVAHPPASGLGVSVSPPQKGPDPSEAAPASTPSLVGMEVAVAQTQAALEKVPTLMAGGSPGSGLSTGIQPQQEVPSLAVMALEQSPPPADAEEGPEEGPSSISEGLSLNPSPQKRPRMALTVPPASAVLPSDGLGKTPDFGEAEPAGVPPVPAVAASPSLDERLQSAASPAPGGVPSPAVVVPALNAAGQEMDQLPDVDSEEDVPLGQRRVGGAAMAGRRPSGGVVEDSSSEDNTPLSQRKGKKRKIKAGTVDEVRMAHQPAAPVVFLRSGAGKNLWGY